VISLDTNQVWGQAPDGALIRMLEKVAGHTGHELVLPEIVVEEYLADYRQQVEVAANTARRAIDNLRRLVPSWYSTAPSFGSVAEMAEERRRDQLAQIFRIHPTPAGAWREAMLREARRRPPAKTSWEKPGSGARDVVVWLTVLDACSASAVETHFVTANSSDFGKNASLRPDLIQDLDEHLGKDAARFRYHSDIQMLMNHLGIEHVQAPDSGSIGQASPVRKAVEAALNEGQAFFEFIPGIPNTIAKFVSAWEGIQDLHFDRIEGKPVAYRIGGDIWASARGKWAGCKEFTVAWKPEFVPSSPPRPVRVDFTVNATVVMQLGKDGAIEDAEVTDRSRLVIVGDQASG
jgi:PIN domain